MKIIPFILCSLLFSSCHNFPKDSYAEDVNSTINTPWGPSTFKARTLATGKAAQNASTPEVGPYLTPLPRASDVPKVPAPKSAK